ncbi:MAG: asparagine synthetase A [Sulfolobales archaeon]|nr:asparagine synthetase A [Sulfolobales archaeon]MCX8198694.1 asparagine synthetase A [Sulfolobales archaeon]MDW8169767.1 asparagine synthetase A [Desulfurococcaceae archaeon]
MFKHQEKRCNAIAWIAKIKGDTIIARTYSGFRRLTASNEILKSLIKLPLESSIVIEGVCSEEEIIVESYRVLNLPKFERRIDYTADLRSVDPVELAKNSHWYLRNPLWAKILKIQEHIVNSAREFLHKKGFTELLPLVISPATDPGLRGARKVKACIYGVEHEVSSSIIMYKQATAAVFGKVFFVARNVREEPPENIISGRHLVEFTQIDLEIANASLNDVIDLGEGIVYYICEKTKSNEELLSGVNDSLECFKPPYPRVTYDDALSIVSKLGFNVKWGVELTSEAEIALANYFNSPVWITEFPSISRGFYYLQNPRDSRYNVDFNLIMPGVCGEVIDGGLREYTYEKLIERIRLHNEPLEKYEWFLDLAKHGGIPPSAGLGLGVERLTMYIAGLRHIALATAFPKLPGLTKTP